MVDKPKPRRAKGDGGITKRANGNYQASYLPGKGKSRAYIYAKTRTEARRLLNQAIHDRDRGKLPADDKITVKEFLTQWLESIQSEVRPDTHDAHSSNVRANLVPILGDYRLAELSATHMQELKSELQKKKLSGESQRRIYTVLKRALKQAVRWGLIHSNPADNVDAPRVERKEQRVLTKEEAKSS